MHKGVRRRNVIWSLLWIALLGSSAAGQGSASIFRDADLALGEKLIARHECQACHGMRVGGNATSIHGPAGRIHTAGALRTMVEACNTEMGFGMFPDEVTAVAAVLDRDHHGFD